MLASLLIGTILVPINSTMISVALTPMAQNLHVQIPDITWLVTVYLLVMASVQPLSGKINDAWGRKRTFIAGSLLFLIASIGCMYARNLETLTIFRGIQALGGAIMTPASSALIRVNLPDKWMGRAFGIMSLVMGLGAAVGPMIGAELIGFVGWRWLFGVNIPFMVACIVLAMIVIPESRGESSYIDWAGSILLLCSLSGGALMLTEKLPLAWYWILLWFMVVVSFFIWQNKTKHPVIQFKFFRDVRFTVANLSILFCNFTMYATLLIMPIFLKQRFSISLDKVGFFLFIFALSMSLTSGFGAAIAERIGQAATIGIGFACAFVSSGLYWLCLCVWVLHSTGLLIGLFIFGGLAAGIGVVSMQTMSLKSVAKPDSGSASGIYSTFRYIGSILSSVMIALFNNHVSIIFTAMVCVSAVGGLLILSRFKAIARFANSQTAHG